MIQNPPHIVQKFLFSRIKFCADLPTSLLMRRTIEREKSIIQRPSPCWRHSHSHSHIVPVIASSRGYEKDNYRSVFQPISGVVTHTIPQFAPIDEQTQSMSPSFITRFDPNVTMKRIHSINYTPKHIVLEQNYKPYDGYFNDPIRKS